MRERKVDRLTDAHGSVARGVINDQWELALTPDRVEFHRVRPNWERGRLQDCAMRMKPGHTVIDVGAECGDFTALYRQWVGPSGRVIAVEPQPAYWPSIRRTWEANYGGEALAGWWVGFAGADTTVHKFADEIRVQNWPRATWPNCSVGTVMPDFGFRHLAQQADSTPTMRLDDLVSVYGLEGETQGIVIDVEGAEVEVALGMRQTLETGGVDVWVSWHQETAANWYQRTLRDLHRVFADHGYTPTELPHYGEAEIFYRYSR